MTRPEDTLRRWRLILGGGPSEGTGCELAGDDIAMDQALGALYGSGGGSGGGGGAGGRLGGSGASSPKVARWLGDIRKYFPSPLVQVMQKDAMERLNLKSLLAEPEMLEAVQPDVNLVANLISLGGVIPRKTRETARLVVGKVVDQLLQRLEEPLRSAVSGALNRAERNRRPRFREIDWNRTIRRNLKHYQERYRSVIPEELIGFGRKAQSTRREIILCIDQSGSMASSVVYSSIFGAVLASLPAVRTRLVAFDTEVVDLTERIADPVDVLFGVQLGGGTFINKAVGYCQGLIREPANTILVLISDLYEGGVESELLQRAADLLASGVQLIVLLALSDDGAPAYDKVLAQKLSNLGAPAFACTPDLFPDLMAAAIKRQDIGLWAATRDLNAVPPGREPDG